MRTSVLVIARNEGRHIGPCIESLLAQSIVPDEIVVVAHNCDDDTEAMARKFPVTVVPYAGPAGALHARIEGFRRVRGEVVTCIDGDSVAALDWLETITQPFSDNGVVLAGGRVKMRGTLSAQFAGFKCTGPFARYIAGTPFPVWGANFAVRMSAYHMIHGFDGFFEVHRVLQLPADYCPDDFYLSLALGRIGRSVSVPSATVATRTKEKNSWEGLRRSWRNQDGGRRIRAYMKKESGGW